MHANRRHDGQLVTADRVHDGQARVVDPRLVVEVRRVLAGAVDVPVVLEIPFPAGRRVRRQVGEVDRQRRGSDGRRNAEPGHREARHRALEDPELILDHTVLVQHHGVELVSVDVENDRPEHVQRTHHDRVIQRASRDLARVTRHRVNDARMRIGPDDRFDVRAVAGGIPVARRGQHGRTEGRGNVVVPLER